MTIVVVPTDDYSPICAGDTGAPFAPIFVHKDLSPVNLSGATITMRIQDDETGITVDSTGTWSIDDAINGKTHYSYSAADVATAGPKTLYIKITIGGEPVHADVKSLQILAVP